MTLAIANIPICECIIFRTPLKPVSILFYHLWNPTSMHQGSKWICKWNKWNEITTSIDCKKYRSLSSTPYAVNPVKYDPAHFLCKTGFKVQIWARERQNRKRKMSDVHFYVMLMNTNEPYTAQQKKNPTTGLLWSNIHFDIPSYSLSHSQSVAITLPNCAVFSN